MKAPPGLSELPIILTKSNLVKALSCRLQENRCWYGDWLQGRGRSGACRSSTAPWAYPVAYLILSGAIPILLLPAVAQTGLP